MAAARGACASVCMRSARGWVLRRAPSAALVPPPHRRLFLLLVGPSRPPPRCRRRQAADAAAYATSSSSSATANANAAANTEDDDDGDWQQRSRLLFETRGLDALRSTRVLVVGLGGVGSYAAEALARAGVGAMTIVDGDGVDATNRNRQLIALRSTVGRPKAEVLAERLLDVNPALRLTALQRFLDPEGAAALLVRPPQEGEEPPPPAPPHLHPHPHPHPAPPPTPHYDYVLDCIDSIAPKVALIAAAARAGSRVVSAMGAGGRVDPSRVRLVDAAHTQGDALGRAVRKGLKKSGVVLSSSGDGAAAAGRRSRGAAEEDGDDDESDKDDEEQAHSPSPSSFRPPPGTIVCVFSDEPARRASLKESRSPSNPYKASYFGTSSYVPAAFGLAAASAVVRAVADGAAMTDLLWVPPGVVAAKERERKRKKKKKQQQQKSAQRRREAAAVAEAEAGAGTEAGPGPPPAPRSPPPPPPQEDSSAARLRAWADRTLSDAGAGGVGVDGSGI